MQESRCLALISPMTKSADGLNQETLGLTTTHRHRREPPLAYHDYVGSTTRLAIAGRIGHLCGMGCRQRNLLAPS